MKKTIWLLSIIIVVLCICLFYFMRLNSEYDKKYIQRGVLTNFNKLDYERMNIFYERFQDHKGDNLMLISRTTDSGPIIYEVNSNGSEIRFTIDATRDAYSGEKEKNTYFCKEMNKEEGIHNNIFTVSNCKGFEKDDIKGYLQFSREMNIFK
ncbi:DUF4362 domain-containing protein [Paenibacillus macquariensis]|uniref:DUF4362 domain-containing protein n=1 Tax=Paenibacillus macquariensis TaxID=948756 RepID=A0ABY1JMB9_9BACL|nr:DUF4362 domain-containing protein [Paenibacillus macquariensis]MEC0092334.1 DUF4362 domain-containing protein [Paenibacillus macquariensis]OAB37127.1 hypothetical protein PMSM_03350 [Paenibacillus macquariensis subsp. macquariensis]SIQ45947.1 protein of unknown function [Paenibacillus macquariensis]